MSKNRDSQGQSLARLPQPSEVAPGRAVLVMGCDYGAEQNLDAYASAFARRELPFDEFIFADAVPSRAERLAALARERGLPARATALTARDLPRRHDLRERVGLIISHIDRAAARRVVLSYALAEGLPFMSYFVLAMPKSLPLGFATVLTPDDYGPGAPEDAAPVRDLITLLDTVAPITARRGSASVIRSSPEASLRDADIRARFREHAKRVMAKVAVLPPDAAAIEATDGQDVLQTVVSAGDRWLESDELEEYLLLGRRDVLLEPGRRILVAEALSGAEPELRLHDTLFRERDRRLAVRGSETITREDFEPRPVREARDRSDGGGVADVLLLLAVVAVLFGGASRTAPLGSTD